MSKHIGRLVHVGLAKESSRGTAVDPTWWLPKMDFKHDDQAEVAVDESSIGVIEHAQGQDLTKTLSAGELTGRVNDTSFGLWLLGAFGQVAAPALVGGQTVVYDHVFSVLESASHPSLTVCVKGPNDGNGLRYALSAVEGLEINMELKKYLEYKVKFRGNKSATGASLTPTYAAEKIFLPQHGSFKFATNLAGLGAASAIAIRKFSLSINKNLEDDDTIGSTAATDRLNKQLEISGSVELLWDARTYVDTNLITQLAQAVRFTVTNTDAAIGTGSVYPTLTIDLAKTQLTEVARSQPNNDLVSQTLNFTGFYSLADSSIGTATLRNLKATTY